MTTETTMVEKFQCSGCVCGFNTECGRYEPETNYEGGFGHKCKSHVIGTTLLNVGAHIALGLPRGFNRSGPDPSHPVGTGNKMLIRLWKKGTAPKWNKFNVAVWALEEEGYLFVRTLSPRIALVAVDVVEGGTLALVPNALDVSKFRDEMD